MADAIRFPGVNIEERGHDVPDIIGVPTSTGLFVGWNGRGPLDEAVRVDSFAAFGRAFGGLDPRSLLGYSVQHFFDNGGRDAWVVRLAAPDAAAAQATLGAGVTVDARSPGAWANRYKIRTTRDAASVPPSFRLEVLDGSAGDAIVETHANLSLRRRDPGFASDVVNSHSEIVRLTVKRSGVPPTDRTLFLGRTTAQANPVVRPASRAGADGRVLAPADADFHAALLARVGSGSVTDRIDLFNLLCVPGLAHAPTLASLQAECRRRRAFLIIDAPPTATVGRMASEGTVGLDGQDASFSALYVPWVRTTDPAPGGVERDFPPSGGIAGVMARTDAQRGVWKAPAGSDARLASTVGLTARMRDSECGQLNSLGINCLRTLPAGGNVIWGARTLQGRDDQGSEWKYIPVRRMALFVEESIHRGTRWAAFEPNGEALWAKLRLAIDGFMHNLFRQGAFPGSSAREAFFVKCDAETMTRDDISNGIVNIQVGFAPLRPAEFVVLRIRQRAGNGTA